MVGARGTWAATGVNRSIDSASSKIVKRIRQRVTFWERFLVSARDSFSAEELSDLRVFCLFVGYPRSGSTLVASMLNAHPDVLLGLEVDSLGFARWGANRGQLFHAIRSSADTFAQAGGQWEGYDYRIETPWVNGWRTLRVIGDKEAAMSAVRLARDGSLVSRLKEAVGVPVKVIHVVRNPFDNIATMYLRGRYPILRLPLSKCIDDFAAMASTIEELKVRLAPDDLLEVRHEDVVDRPVECLQRLCGFLDVESEPEYILAATRIVSPSANRSRDRLVWQTPDVHAVEEIIAKSSAHRSYSGTRPSRVVANANRSAQSPRHGPDFLVIGAQRCGTTLIHRLLERHSEVYVPKHRKEIHFFDDHYELGEDWYRGFFPVDRAGLTALGEVSPSYLADPRVPQRIYEFYPGMRLIVLLRHPIDRLWSAYHHLRRTDGESRSFTDFIRQDVEALERGKYGKQLARYAARFPKRQLLIVLLEELLRDSATQLLRIQDFLELREPWDIDRADLVQKVNENFVTRYPKLYRNARHAGHFLTYRLDQGRIASHVKRSRAMSLFKGGEISETMTPRDRAYLTQYYAPDVARLREELGIETAAITWELGAWETSE
jgi:Sulfotransferase domain/Sulfotransferase family